MIVLIAALVLVTASAVAYGAVSAYERLRPRRLEEALAPYGVGAREPGPSVAGEGGELVESPILRRLAEALADAAARRGILQTLQKLLDQADLPVRPSEALFVYLVSVVIGGAIGALAGNAFWGLVGLGVVGIVPWVALKGAAVRRTQVFTAQLPDMLQLLSTTLRSGFSILQGLETVSRQLTDPIGKEIRHVVAEARLGRPLVEALHEVSERVQSEDFEWVVTAIGIQREVGGNLAELLDIVADTMNARARLRREARTLTAEGRIGAVVISVLPIALGLFVYGVNPSYISPLFHTASGQLIFYGSVAMGVVGIFWLRKLVDIEV